ncbi:hypothetical protein LOC68_06735 [Blastopirellula sp. JC732]|uniref:Uncharacterized protein n=1 Tax=Blastopirellula sediminis TaxID=2894196 RepID=A0A9X1MKU1_9BACT|nr:hypothetical protein [Blastopirellula sediminis]MCC9609138.1 hypothetical protein [Blastopirellula sediminis]MCC9628085.1 hypothetical protein [Blastopirellula sediminis]
MSTSKEKDLVFLCPNGHKLHAPRKLQGQAGQCPHCNVKFRVPVVDGDEANAGGDASRLDSSIDVPSSTNKLIGPSQSSIFESSPTEVGIRDEAGASNVLGPGASRGSSPSVVLNGHSRLFQEFLRLWSLRRPGATVEIHLPEGEIFVPEYFSPSRSTAEFGFFARSPKSGEYAVNLIPWQYVCRIVLTGIKELPSDLTS